MPQDINPVAKVCNNQETFDKCINHLRQQKKKAVFLHEGHITGAYKKVKDGRGPVGFLLGDLAVGLMEGKTVDHPDMFFIMESVLHHNGKLCRALQKIHDEIDPDWWENEFQILAMTWKLVYHITPELREQLEPKEVVDKLMGYLIQGLFVSWDRVNELELRSVQPRPVKIMQSQIGNTSQICSRSKQLVVDGLKNRFGKPECTFPY